MDRTTNKMYFIDVIPGLEVEMGITRLEHLHVAIRQARYYGHEELAQWFEKAQERLTRAIEEEWNVD